ncbi:ABC transporter ATP-binding protein [Desulfococcaceae bacterium HSG7]|nr:ABC transporter ATP-binding protein [Desulfococcaceae bacterium HSG7]
MTAECSPNENLNDKASLEIKNVRKQFGDLVAVDDVSLDIKKGEIFSFLGPSGCGKTTLLRCIAGLEEVDDGEILIGGEVVNHIPPYKRNCTIVFQQHALFPHMSVFDNIAFGLVELKVAKDEIKRRVGELVDMVNLNGMEDRFPSQLSGGQQQRVALVRSLILRPAVLLLDEPLAALDRKLRKEMQVELKRIQREVETTFMNVTHDQKEALSLSDRIAVMKDGKIVQLGSPSDIYEKPRTKFVADFMGASNIFPGRAEAGKNGKIEFRSDEGLELTLPDSNEIDIDTIEGVSVHPEVIGIAKDKSALESLESDEYSTFSGKVKDIFYQGDFSELTVTLNDVQQDLSINKTRGISPEEQLSAGQDVIVYWNWANSNILISK